MKTIFEIPLIRATNDNLKGYGNLVDNFDNCQIQITQWPKQGWREIDPGTGDEGGITEGSFDEGIRHAITKLSHLHFVSTEVYRKRVIQLGESPENIFNVGGLGTDAIKRTKLMPKDELEKELGINFRQKNLLITYHPLTLSPVKNSENEIIAIIQALEKEKETLQIFTMPNADTDGRVIYEKIRTFCMENKNSFILQYSIRKSCLKKNIYFIK